MADTGFTALRQFSFTTRPYLAVDDETGAPIGLDDLDVRVGWLLDLISGAEAQLLSRLWQPATCDVLAAGCDRQGRKLPMQGHVAAARLGWTPHYPDGVYVPSRVTRVVTAQAVGTLRALAYRDTSRPDSPGAWCGSSRRTRAARQTRACGSPTCRDRHRRARWPGSRPPIDNSHSLPSPVTSWC
nr:hypothetical protein GCM10017611_58130 [Rhodococcus wratislaviensis]